MIKNKVLYKDRCTLEVPEKRTKVPTIMTLKLSIQKLDIVSIIRFSSSHNDFYEESTP